MASTLSVFYLDGTAWQLYNEEFEVATASNLTSVFPFAFVVFCFTCLQFQLVGVKTRHLLLELTLSANETVTSKKLFTFFAECAIGFDMKDVSVPSQSRDYEVGGFNVNVTHEGDISLMRVGSSAFVNLIDVGFANNTKRYVCNI